MTLPMARPFKHPNSGVYWLRKRVPDDLRPIVGKREEKLSLGTRDPEEAKRLHAQALLDLEARWTSLRQGTRALSKKEIERAAALLFDYYLAHFCEGIPDRLRSSLDISDADRMWGRSDPARRLGDVSPFALLMVATPEVDRGQAREIAAALTDDYLRSHGLLADQDSKARLLAMLGVALRYAGSDRMSYEERGVPSFDLPQYPRPAWTRLPREVHQHVLSATDRKTTRSQATGLKEIFDGWVGEKQPRDRTRYAWERVLDQLGEFLGHTDASLVSADDIIRWKSALLADGLRAKTIRDGKLAPIRAIFQWAVDNRRLPQNPAERVTIDLKSKLSDRKRGYSDDEARSVLKAARTEKDALRRWVPWLCAYTGARVAEVCQLRVEDVAQTEGIWSVRFVPEAGSLKNASSERAVPLHPALVDEGILNFVKAVKSGPLFVDIKPDRFGSRGGNGTKVLSRWVRSLGLTDPRLSPNHSWRHRLRTLGRRYGLSTDILDAITGHQRKTVADTYGEFPIEALNREMRKIPALAIDPP